METIRNDNLHSLATQLKTQQERKCDIVLPSNQMYMADGEVHLNELPADLLVEEQNLDTLLGDFNIDSQGVSFRTLRNAERQIGNKFNIPVRYYRYLKEDHTDILDDTVTKLFNRADKDVFVRSFAPEDGSGTGILRAMLSDRFKVIDNLPVLMTALKAIKESGRNIEVGKCNLSENNMYVEFFDSEVRKVANEHVKNYQSPDGSRDGQGGIMTGFVLSNSEVGRGSFKITPRLMMLVCKNGMTAERDAMNRTHLGSKMDSGIRWSSETKDKELDLILSQVDDAIETFLSEDYIGSFVDRIVSNTQPLEHPIQAVENVSNELSISEDEQKDILNYFMNSGDTSSFGVAQAITYHAHETAEPERQYELEGQVYDILPNIPDFDVRSN